MNMVKSLLLGSAAGLVAVAGAQAADLPVKAKAVEYVKVCSAYGAGYYYIPGTDTCLKIGGYVRFDTYINATGTMNPFISNQTLGNGLNTNDLTDNYRTRTRGLIRLDARTQTDYGVLRSYAAFGGNLNSWSSTNGNTSLEVDRAFIQFAGLTAGYTTSFFDPNLNYMMTTPYTMTKRKLNQLAYTAQFGNGFSATIAVEDQRFIDVYDQTAYGPNTRGGSEAPDIVGNLRLEQAWGSAQLAVAAHQSRVAYSAAAFDDSTDVWGWGIGGTLEFDLDALSPGDSFFVTAAYGDGALNYVGLNGSDRASANATQFGRVTNNSLGALGGAFYQLSDIVYNGVNDYDKTKAWSINGQFRHFWTPGLRSAVMVGYVDVDAPETAFALNNGFADFNMWQVGFNTIWSPVKNLDIGAEVLYSKVEGKHDYNDGSPLQALNPVGVGYGGSTDLVSGGLRIQRNF
ncbi:porin [Xanthobacter sp. TB0139]|uniref:porin n=1 Tax=Xanthobacter sp. TB0139 TaxID=3459178 RepID=UPI004039DC19